MMQKGLGEKGLSLVELMIAIVTSSVIAYVLFVAMRIAGDGMETSDLKMSIQSSAREGLYRMLQEIRETSPSRVTVGSGGTSIQFNVPDPSNPVTAGYAVNWPGHTVQYARAGTNNTQIIRTNSTTGQTSVIANDVSALNFTVSGSQVTVTMSVQRILRNGRTVPATALQLTGQARLRNTG